MSSIPQPPPGFVLDDEEGMGGVPPPPPGFVLDTDPPPAPRRPELMPSHVVAPPAEDTPPKVRLPSAPRPPAGGVALPPPTDPKRAALLEARRAGLVPSHVQPAPLAPAHAPFVPPQEPVDQGPVGNVIAAMGAKTAQGLPGMLSGMMRAVPEGVRDAREGLIETILNATTPDLKGATPEQRKRVLEQRETLRAGARLGLLATPLGPAIDPAVNAARAVDESLVRPWEERLAQHPRIQSIDRKFKEKSLGQLLKDPEAVAGGVASGATSLIPMVLAPSSSAGFVLGAVLEGGGALRDIEQYEKETGKAVPAAKRAATVGLTAAISGALDRVGFETATGELAALLPRRSRKGFLQAVTQGVQGAAGEIVTEEGQTAAANVITRLLVDPTREWHEGWKEALIGAAGAGGGAGVMTGAGRAMDVAERGGRMAARRAWVAEDASRAAAPATSPFAESGPGRGAVPQETVDAINEGVRALRNPETADEGLRRLKLQTEGLDARFRALKGQEGLPTHEERPRPGYQGRAGDELAQLEAQAATLNARLEELRRGRLPAPAPPGPYDGPIPTQPAHEPISVDRLLGAQALPGVVKETRFRDQTAEARGRNVLGAIAGEERQRVIGTPGAALRMILEDQPAAPPSIGIQGRTSADASRVAPLAPAERSPAEPFDSPEDADRSFLESLGLSPEQAREVGTRMPTTDEVTGYATTRHHGPALERAQRWAERTGRPAQYVEIDLHNLGGMNAALGHSGADRVVRQMTDAVRAEFPEEHGKRVAFIRHGGDELSLVATGYTEAEITASMERAEEAASRVVREAGLEDIAHAKGATDEAGRERRRGAGIYWGAAPIEPGVSLSRTREVADFAVEARKFTRRAEDVDRKQAVPSRNPSGPRSGGDAAADTGRRASGTGSAPEGERGERAEALRNLERGPAAVSKDAPPEGVAGTPVHTTRERELEAFQKRHGEDAAGLDRFLSLADAVRKEAPDASPEEIHEAALSLFDEERRRERNAPRGAEVDARPGAADSGNARGREALAEGTRRAPIASESETSARPVARSYSRPPEPGVRGIPVRDLEEAVSRAEAAWPGAPEIAVIRNETELPLEVQEQLAGEKVRGVYHGGRHGTTDAGTVYLLADRVGSVAEAFETLVHELVGHAGIVAVLGPKGWRSAVDEILESREGRKLVETWTDAHGSAYGFDLSTEAGRQVAVGETVAWIAERRLSDPKYQPPSFYRRLVARVRLWLRGIGRRFGVTPEILEWNAADIDSLIARAARKLEGPSAGEAPGTWFSRQEVDESLGEGPALSEAQRRRVADLVSRTRNRLAEVDPRWRVVAEDLVRGPAAEASLEEGIPHNPGTPTRAGEPGRPDLANPGVEPEGRRLADRVDRARQEEGEPVRRADAEVNAEADRRLESDWNGERRALLERGRQGTGLDDVETVTAKKIISAEAFAAMRSRDVETLAETAELIDAYRRTGAEQARAFRQRRDQVMSPRERMAAFVAEAVLRPGEATAERIRTGTPSQRREALRRHVEQAKSILSKLRERGIDVANLSEEDLADRFFVARVVREVAAQRSDVSDKVFEFWANSILSGPLTHIANVTGNTVSLVVEYAVQQPLEMALGSLTGGSRSLAEGRALYGAMWRGVVRGTRNAVESFQTEQRALGEAGDPLAPDRLDARVAIGGRPGRVVRVPYRVLRAADEFYRGLIGEMEAAATAHAIARKEGLAGEAFAHRIENLLEDGDSAAWQAATDRADLLTFQEELGKFGRLVIEGRRKVPGLRYVLPFVTTPANIFKTALRKSPAGGGRSLYLLSQGELSRDKAIRSGAEQLIGLGVIALLAQGIGGGDDDDEPWITGTVPFRGSRKGERDLAARTAPPLSLRVGRKWYGYGRLEPLATWLGVTVDGLRGVKEARAGKEPDAVVGETLKRFAGQLEDKTFLDGIGRIIRAIDDGRSAARIVGDVAGGFVPALIRQPAQAAEAKVRESRAWGAGPSPKHEGERYESRLARRIAERAAPFAFEGTTKVNAYGLDVEKTNRSFLGRLLSPRPALRPGDATRGRSPDRCGLCEVEREKPRRSVLPADPGSPLHSRRADVLPQG